jgi:hypothetical protein
MTDTTVEMLQQNWVHSHEEDQDGRMVFRPEFWSFPLSRGRRSFRLGAGGKLIAGGPDPTDKHNDVAGTWRLLPDATVELAPAGQRPLRLIIIEATPDKLVVRIDAAH